jgi:glutathione synthase/RimK-type ligase-like ATP-grasp enzyme
MVRADLAALRVPSVVLFQETLGQCEIDFDIRDGKSIGELRIGGIRYPLVNFNGAYIRLVEYDDSSISPSCGDTYANLLAWLEVADARVVTKVSSMGSNYSKPYQLQLIKNSGFAVPETLVTNDPDIVIEFMREHKQVIYKSISSIRSVVKLIEQKDVCRLDNILWCPTLFQAFVEGTNVRVHVIGSTVYACAIYTDAVDYRYAHREGKSLNMREIHLPKRLVEKCIVLAAELQLPVAGLDLIVSSGGEAYCLEVNPSPAFSYYQQHTGQLISRSVARYLAGLEG